MTTSRPDTARLASGLRLRWPITAGAEVREELLAAYGDPARGYHDLLHLTEVLDRLDQLARVQPGAATGAHSDARSTSGRLPVLLAAWFHDAVYDGQPDAEERSALLAEARLPGCGMPGDIVREVGRLVRLTAHHRPEPHDAPGGLLVDADLGILAADDERYAAYVAAVRSEYAHISDADFRAGRRAILQALAEKERLFHTAAARGAWEQRARANLSRELAELAD